MIHIFQHDSCALQWTQRIRVRPATLYSHTKESFFFRITSQVVFVFIISIIFIISFFHPNIDSPTQTILYNCIINTSADVNKGKKHRLTLKTYRHTIFNIFYFSQMFFCNSSHTKLAPQMALYCLVFIEQPQTFYRPVLDETRTRNVQQSIFYSFLQESDSGIELGSQKTLPQEFKERWRFM